MSPTERANQSYQYQETLIGLRRNSAVGNALRSVAYVRKSSAYYQTRNLVEKTVLNGAQTVNELISSLGALNAK
jgi:hypothetical protein